MEPKGALLIVEDDPIMGESLQDRFALEGYAASLVKSAEAALAHLAQHPVGLVISDLRLPGLSGRELLRRSQTQTHAANRVAPPFIMITGAGSINDAVEALKDGAADYITKPFDLNRLVEKVGALCLRLTPEGINCPPLGISLAMRQMEQLLPRISAQARTILLTGESGVGKECVARRIHLLAEAGKTAPFIALNCAALPESLFEGELFGHEKGAYTGADRMKQGLLEAANGGTLFLDEIGEMGLALQAKLLRVVQEREFMRIGSTKPLAFNARLIFATNRELRREVERGAFREDLFYRINVIQIRIPPLRERHEDIPWLAENFVAELSRSLIGGRKTLDEKALEALAGYGWPGNVRELRHVIERACILSASPVIGIDDLWDAAPDSAAAKSVATGGGAGGGAAATAALASYDLASYLQGCERRFIGEALAAHDGQMTATAQALGISRKSLWERLRRLETDGKS